MLRKPAIVICALAVLYTLVRLWRLSDSCLWFDEIFSVHAAEHAWGSMFWFVAQDLIHPPLFYVVLKLWIGIGGESVYWLRLLPVTFSVLALIPLVRLGRELKFRTSVIVLSLCLLAVNGALIKYTQTLRMYSMLMFLSLLSVWLFARYFNRGKSFVPLVITNVLLIYTHYFGFLVIGSELLALLFFQRIKWRRALVMTGVVLASFVPWFVALMRAASQGSDLAQNIAWQARPGIRELITFATDLIEPFYLQASSAEAASIYVISTPLLLVVVTMIALYVVEWNREDHKRPIYLLLIFIVFPFSVAFIASWSLPHSVWGTRHLIMIFPLAMLLIANAVLNFPVRAVSYVAVGAIVVLSAIGFVKDVRREMPRHVWCAWNDVAADIRDREAGAGTSVPIYAFENLVAYHVWFATRDSDRLRVGVVKGVDVKTDDETYFLPRGFGDVVQTSPSGITDERLWIVFRISRAGDEVPIIESFTKGHYSICNSYRYAYDSTTVLWVELKRTGSTCRQVSTTGD